MRLLPIGTFRAVCALVLATVAALCVAGCRSLDSPNDLSALGKDAALKSSPSDDAELADTGAQAAAAVANVDAGADPEQADAAEELPRPQPLATPTTDAEADALLVLLGDTWTIEPDTAPGAERAPYRWRHAGLDELSRAPDEERADLTKFLSSDDPVVAANAAIVLARADDSSADLELVEAVRNVALKQSLRCAAAEALGRPDSVLASIALAELLTDYGNATAEQYSPELHAELLRSLGRQVDAADSPQLSAGLKNASGEVRRAAIEGFAAEQPGELPQELMALRTDPEPQVRVAVVDCLVARRHPQAQEYCLAALGDVHLDVQLAGVAGLGVLGGDAASRALGRLAVHEAEQVRAAAVAALVMVGDDVAVFVAAKDSSWHVRRNVARGLARFPTERGGGVARQLLADANAEVRSGVIEAVGHWPLAQAGPLLLTAMSDAPQPTRDQAAQQLTRLWPAAEGFSPDAPPDLRHDQIRQLQTAWQSVVAEASLAPREDVASGPASAIGASAPDAVVR